MSVNFTVGPFATYTKSSVKNAANSLGPLDLIDKINDTGKVTRNFDSYLGNITDGFLTDGEEIKGYKLASNLIGFLKSKFDDIEWDDTKPPVYSSAKYSTTIKSSHADDIIDKLTNDKSLQDYLNANQLSFSKNEDGSIKIAKGQSGLVIQNGLSFRDRQRFKRNERFLNNEDNIQRYNTLTTLPDGAPSFTKYEKRFMNKYANKAGFNYDASVGSGLMAETDEYQKKQQENKQAIKSALTTMAGSIVGAIAPHLQRKKSQNMGWGTDTKDLGTWSIPSQDYL